MDMEIDSETPPSSPIIGYSALRSTSNFDSDDYCFECKGSVRPTDLSFSPKGLMAKGELISSLKLLNKNSHSDSSTDVERETVEYKFFNLHFEPTPEKLRLFIIICRKNIFTLESTVQSIDTFSLDLRNTPEEDKSGSQWWELRRNVCNFLNFTIKNSQVFRPGEDLMQQFIALRKSLLNTEAWPTSLKQHGGTHGGNQCCSPHYHFFHLLLELRWFFLILSNASPVIIDWILQDLIYLAWFKYTSEKMNEWNAKTSNKVAFNCYCVKELWTMLRHIVDEMKPHGKDFWDFVTTSLGTFKKSGKDKMFPLWLITNLAPLKKYTLKGHYLGPSGDQNSACYPYVRELLKEILADKCATNREVMDLLYSLLPVWGSDVGMMQTMWSFWATQINVSSGFLDHNYWKSPEKWAALVKSIVPPPSEGPDLASDSCLGTDAFFPCIRLFCGHIKYFAKEMKIQKLTNLIYLRLPDSKAINFGEIGLIRLSTVHLASIASVSEEEVSSVCKPFMNSFRSLYNDLLRMNKQSVRTIFTAQLTMFLLLLDKGINVEPLAKLFMEQVSALMLRDSKLVVDSRKRELVMVYLEFLDCLPKYGSQLDLDQVELFCVTFPVWLNSVTPDYQNRAFRVFHNLLSWLLPGNRLPELIQKVYDCTKDTVKKLAYAKYSNTGAHMDLEPLVDLAADFTYYHRHDRSILYSFFETFALEVKVSAEISQIYMEKILNYRECIITDDLKLLQAWVRLTCLGAAVPTKLTEVILQDPEGLLGLSNNSLLKEFCLYASDNDCWQRKDMEEILQPLINLCCHNWSPFKDNKETLDAIINSCTVILSSLKFTKIYASRVLCVGKSLLDFLSSFWVPVSEVLAPIWVKYLPQIFMAITAFPMWDTDQYLQRQVQMVVSAAFLGFTSPEFLRNFENHPAVKIMKAAEEDDITPAMEFLSQIKFNPSAQKPNPQSDFLKTLSIFTKRDVKLISVVVHALPTVLSIARSSTATAETNACLEIICSLLDPKLTSSVSQPVLESKMRDAFEQDMAPNLSLSWKKYFKLFSNMTTYKCSYRAELKRFLKEQLVPLICELIKLCQLQRGTGQNDSLWKALELLELELERNF